MNDGLPRQAPLVPGTIGPPATDAPGRPLPRTSRHADSPTYRREVAGRELVLLEPRFPTTAPPTPARGGRSAAEEPRTVEVAPGDRLDLLAWRLLGDPHQYWRLADANPGDLDALEEPGRELRIPEVG